MGPHDALPSQEAAPARTPALAPLVTPGGTLFRVCSRSASRLFLQLYDDALDREPARTLELAPERDRTGDVWEVFVPGAGHGQLYTWAADPARPLLDPWSLAVSGPERFGADDPDRPRPPLHLVNRDARMKSVVVAADPPLAGPRPRTRWRDSVIYEVHVRGFTRHPSAGAEDPGTYRALAARADYLADLGVTAVELLPVHEFDETSVRRGRDLHDFWGYSPIAWFAPMRRYASPAAAAAPAGPVAEFRAMVRALHAAGIEVLVDVVFNHTGELHTEGPTWNLRGLDDAIYYLHQPRTGDYANLTGCGNTVRAQHPTVRALIRHALRWWVHGLGVDGFRFDLGAVLCRSEDGALLAKPPLLREIEEDPWLRDVRLIAEPWDAAGAYLVPTWPGGDRWSVWNDRFRDDVRRAWLRAPEEAAELATRLCGSSDLFRKSPLRGVNYVTAHDGFTLRDTVSYARKHNESNGEENRDGHGHEVSSNHGHEGPTDDPAIVARRDRARRNLVASLLLAQGVPMLLAGDEIGRTQRGNNNAYCHDDETGWVDWSGLERDRDFHRFVRGLIRLRQRSAALRRDTFLKGGEAGDILWLGPEGNGLDWEKRPGAFGFRLSGKAEHTGAEADEPDLLLLVNLRDEDRPFVLPEGRWKRLVDTAAPPPDDVREPEETKPFGEPVYPLQPKSLAVLCSD